MTWDELKGVRLPDLREWQKQQYGHAIVRVAGELSPAQSLELRFFLGSGDYTPDTSTDGNHAYLGSLGIAGAPKRNSYELPRNGQPSVRVELELDVTDSLLRSLLVHEPLLTVVPVTANEGGNDVRLNALWKPESVEFVVR